MRVIWSSNLGVYAITNVTFQRNYAKKYFLDCFPELPTAHMRKKKEEAFQVAVIRWYYVYDPWRNIKEVGRGGEEEIQTPTRESRA